MELRLLRYFTAVAEELHFSRAALRLHMAQPPLSQQIRRLEEELGVALLTRTKRRVELTEPGRQFLASAQDILARVDRAVAQVQRAARGEAGSLTLAMVSSVAFEDALPRILRRYRELYPEVAITLLEMSADEQLAALKEERIQIGFLRPPVAGPGLAATPFYREPLVAVLPAGHPLASRRILPLQALAGEGFVVVPRGRALGGPDLVLEACLRAGFTPRVAQEARELPSVLGFVAAGFGVSLVPRAARRLRHRGVAFVPLAPPGMDLELAAVHRALDPSPTVAAFLVVLRETAAPARDHGKMAQEKPNAPA